MHHHKQQPNPGKRKIVLVGNPNIGKSVVFAALTGRYVDVSNFPGTTVDITSGSMGNDIIIDTPGVYGISSFTDEEAVTRDIALQADIIVNVVNGSQLQRDLFLTLQLVDMGIPMVLAVNMLDEAQRNGITIDLKRLEQELGVPVVGITATRKQGIDQLIKSLDSARAGKGALTHLLPPGVNRPQAVLLLEDDQETAATLEMPPAGRREEIYRLRRERANRLFERAIKQTRPPKGATLSRLMLRPLTGIPLLFGTLYLMYLFIGVFIAQTVVEFTEDFLMGEIAVPWIVGFLEPVVHTESLWGQILIGDYGLLTMTIPYILGLLLPLVLGFYLLLSLLEDVGYLPRIAALLDRMLVSIGLNGRAVIPMILGFGCVTMATITTRILQSKRERTIATFLLSLAIPCSAQIGVIAALLAPLGMGYALLYAGVILGVYILVGTLLHRLLPGKSSDLLIDLPALRIPQPGNVLKKTWSKTAHFVKEASPLFAIGSILITLLHFSGALEGIQRFLVPLTEGWLRLPRETTTAFIMGIIRRDFGAAGLYDMSLTPAQTVVSLITITLFVPCIASVMVIWKERGWREWIGIFAGTFATAFLVGGIVAWFIT